MLEARSSIVENWSWLERMTTCGLVMFDCKEVRIWPIHPSNDFTSHLLN